MKSILTHTMKYYAAIKKKIDIYDPTWKDPKDILSEQKQSQNNKYII